MTNCGSTHMEALQAYVKEHPDVVTRAWPLTAMRTAACLWTRRAKWWTAISSWPSAGWTMPARGKLRRNTIVGTVLTNMGFSRFCDENGLKFAATKVGDRYVLEEMELEGYSAGRRAEPAMSSSAILPPPATASSTAIQLLCLMKRSGRPLSELAQVMRRMPQVMVNVTVSKEGKLRVL